MTDILIETNTFSAFIKGDKKVISELGKTNNISISVVTIGELSYGFKKGAKEASNQAILENFIKGLRITILKVTLESAKIYGQIKYDLMKKGLPIPENDIWIAAQAIETGSVLVTYDKHFLQIPRVKVWKVLK